MTDKRTVTIVVGALAFLAIMGTGGVVWLVSERIEVAAVAVVSALAGQALGGLTGILASTRTVEGASIPSAPSPPPPAPIPVEVVNPLADPVPVDPA